MYVYLSEDEVFSPKSNRNTLIWQKDGLIYGDWTGGPNGDGTYDFEIHFDTPEVSPFIFYF